MVIILSEYPGPKQHKSSLAAASTTHSHTSRVVFQSRTWFIGGKPRLNVMVSYEGSIDHDLPP